MKAKPRRPRKVAAARARVARPARSSASRRKPLAVMPPTDAAEGATSVVIERLSARGILSFGRNGIDVELGPLNVLIGTNGSGKSNFVELVEFLSALPRDARVSEIMRRAGGAEEWLWKGERHGTADVHTSLRAAQSSAQLFDYVVAIRALGPVVLTFEREVLRAVGGRPIFEAAAGTPTVVFPDGSRSPVELPRGSARGQAGEPPPGTLVISTFAQIRDALHYGELTQLADTLSQLRFYRHWHLGPEALIRRSQPADAPNAYLAEDASNLAVVLSRIRKSPEAKRALVEAVRAVYAGADDVEVVPEGGALRIFIQEGKFAIPATRLSDGTLHWLCLLAVLLDPQPPPLVCIEEPEIALHPDLIQILARLLRDASQRMQIIVTTHSESLVDKFSDTPEVVIVCEREGDQTTMRRLDRAALATWLKRYSLGELWRKGEIGGTRW